MSELPLVGVVMGSKSDYEVLVAAVEILRELQIPHEARVVSAHRTPDLLFEYAETARARGLRVIIAGAGGAAHLRNAGGQNAGSGAGRTGAGHAVEWPGCAAIHCADAQGGAGGHAGNRQGGRGQRGAAAAEILA